MSFRRGDRLSWMPPGGEALGGENVPAHAVTGIRVYDTGGPGADRRKRGIMPTDHTAPVPASTLDVFAIRVFDVPVEEVWKAWSEPTYVRRWWGPEGFTCPLARLDFREGGTSLLCMRAPREIGGQDMYNTWTYTTIRPNERLEFVLKFSDEDGRPVDPTAARTPPGIPTEVRHVVAFTPLDERTTQMTVTEHGYTSAQV